MAMGYLFTTFLVFTIIKSSTCIENSQINKDVSQIVELQDADFFNLVHIEDRDFLVLVVPEHCGECHALTTEFQQNKDEIAQTFPDISLGYIYEHSTSNVLVRRTMDVPTKPSTLIVKALIKNRMYVYSGMQLDILQTYFVFRKISFAKTNLKYISQFFVFFRANKC